MLEKITQTFFYQFGTFKNILVSNNFQTTELLNLLVRFTSDVENHIVAAERIKEYADSTRVSK